VPVTISSFVDGPSAINLVSQFQEQPMRRNLYQEQYIRQKPIKASYNAPARPQVVFYNGVEFNFHNI
jgi:hypothetical protein